MLSGEPQSTVATPPPPRTEGGEHSLAGEGAVGANSDDWRTVPEIIDLVFAKTSPKRSLSMTEYEHFGLVFAKMRVYKFGHSYCDRKLDILVL